MRKDLARTFRVTHPFHPLSGREYDLVTFHQNWGDGLVFYHDENGDLSHIPAVWTDILPSDPFVEIAGGRSLFDPRSLRALCDLVSAMDEGVGGGRQGNYAADDKENMPPGQEGGCG